METLRQIFERETGQEAEYGSLCLSFVAEYTLWLENGITKEYAKRDKLISELQKEIKILKSKQ